jgi:hypothetical protein
MALRRHLIPFMGLLALAVVTETWPSGVSADNHPGARMAFETLRASYQGRTYEIQYRGYAEPWQVDHGAASGRLESPFETMLAFFHTLATMQDFSESIALARRHDGSPGVLRGDPAQQLQAARTILSGKVLLHGEIIYGDYHIFVYRYEKSIPRNLGLPLRRFGDEFYVVQDLVEVDPFAARLSALRWDVERLLREHPAP